MAKRKSKRKKVEKPPLERIRFLNPDNPDWEGLHDKLWEARWERMGYHKRGRAQPVYYPRENVILYEDEWELIKKLITGPPRLPVVPGNVSFGFNVGLTIYGLKFEPYPGAIVTAPCLFRLHPRHLPTYDFEKNRLSFNEVWDILSPLTHCEENIECLRQNGIKGPGTKSNYVY
jgi:hypothetical protein